MPQQQMDGSILELQKLVLQLVKLWENDWDNADYPGEVLPQLIKNPNQATSEERKLLEKIYAVAPLDALNRLPQLLREAYKLIQDESKLRFELEVMIRRFHLTEAQDFFDMHSSILDAEAYAAARSDRIKKRRRSIEQEIQSYRFNEAKELLDESCLVLTPIENEEMQAWFKSQATIAADTILKQKVVPLLKESKTDEARKIYELVSDFITIDEYNNLELQYCKDKTVNPFHKTLRNGKTLLGENGDKNSQQQNISDVKDYKVTSYSVASRKYFLSKDETYRSKEWLIKRKASERGILNLIHFTQLSNIKNILKKGIIPRLKLERENIPHISNDDKRLDKMPNASSLSISFPNYKMFYKYRNQNPSTHWAILLLNPSILWKLHCFFYRTNAASSEMQNAERSKKRSATEFERLFEVLGDEPPRSITKIPDYFTTDPQAEVLVVGDIPPDNIQAIIVGDLETLDNLYQIKNSKIPCAVRREYFEARQDHKYWYKARGTNGQETDFYSAPF